MQTLHDILKPDRPTAIVDVGANPIDGAPPYRYMLTEGLCRVTGFEPQTEALRALQEAAKPNETYLPHVIGTGAPGTLHITYAPGMTSLLRPDPARLAMFERFSDSGRVVATQAVATHRLDDLAEVEAIDFLKMDVQGAEGDVLSGATRKLKTCIAVLTEVSFVTLYEGQPAFGEIDTQLRGLGFIPHCFAESKLWPLATGSALTQTDPHQLLEADILYIRDPVRYMAPEQWKHLALVAHYVCGSFDLAMRAIQMLVQLGALSADAPAHYKAILKRA